MRVSVKKGNIRIEISGRVQGVGFRPFVYRLARKYNLSGWVANSTGGVVIEIADANGNMDEFIQSLRNEKPVFAEIDDIVVSNSTNLKYDSFNIIKSMKSSIPKAILLPDIAVCPECLEEIFDPENRRYRYPFTNCTHCGPRYSIIEALPYDRANTTMKIFPMCDRCRTEYENPLDRRFHAQPVACPECGPHLELWDANGQVVSTRHQSLLDICIALAEGKIIALKGLGGFQLLVDARNTDAVSRLRKRKGRKEKPLAMMFPDIDAVKTFCDITELEEKLLLSYKSPVVILRRRECNDSHISSEVAPDNNPNFGIMLPYTPLHHLLMAELSFPIVATSGNLSGESICIDEHDALKRLNNIADLFLVHNRPIVRQVDDSVVRVISGQEAVIRSARGYAPTLLKLRQPSSSLLAVGAHRKNTVAVSVGNNLLLSQHIGDLETRQTFDTFEETIKSLSSIYELKPEKVISDMHSDYQSTQYAGKLPVPGLKVQHHYAHVLSCMVDNRLKPPVLGVAWDGIGLGNDGTIWGGEFLRVVENTFTRVAHLRHFKLPGGDKTAREPRRSAIGILHEIFGDKLFTMPDINSLDAFGNIEIAAIGKMIENNINSPVTSSMGRLFDAVSSIIGLAQTVDFEGQAAMKLEYAATNVTTDKTYRFDICHGCEPYIIDWEPVIHYVLKDLRNSVPVNMIAARFHNALADLIACIAGYVGEKNVVLTGGCFQNKYLTENAIARLRHENYAPFWHRLIPSNDGGISAGQVMAGIIESEGE